MGKLTALQKVTEAAFNLDNRDRLQLAAEMLANADGGINRHNVADFLRSMDADDRNEFLAWCDDSGFLEEVEEGA